MILAYYLSRPNETVENGLSDQLPGFYDMMLDGSAGDITDDQPSCHVEKINHGKIRTGAN